MDKNLNGKYTQKLLDHAKQSVTDAIKTASKKQFKKQKRLVNWLVIKLLIITKNSPENKSQIKKIKRNTYKYIYIYIYSMYNTVANPNEKMQRF